jgi:signal transduction histidine kinase
MDRMTPAATLRAHGEIASLRTVYWSSTELGSPSSWPPSLTAATSICLNSRFPMALFWGRPSYTMICNDAYRAVLGSERRPRWSGLSACDCWRQVRDAFGPMIDSVFETGKSTWSEDVPIFIDRHVPGEEVYVTFSCSAIYEDRDRVGGVLAVCTETTDRVLYARRVGVLRELGGRLPEARTAAHACQIAGQTLDAAAAHSVAFSLIYLIEQKRARLVAASPSLTPHAAPELVELAAPSASPWRLARVASTAATEVIEDLFERVGPLPGGIWPEPARSALVLPLNVPGKRDVAGVLVAGVTPRHVVDAGCRTFLESVAAHVATAIANARVHEDEHRRAESLAELDRAKTVFFRNISQEFRTPLTLVLGPAEDALADTRDALTPLQRERIDMLHGGAQRLLKLVNTLLDFSRLETGRIEACYEPTDLASLTSEVASVFRSVVERVGLRFVVDCPTLPEPVYVDRGMWEHIVLNLVSNAFKFTFRGEIAVRVSVDGHCVRLRVSDTGAGIKAEELPHLFDQFQQLKYCRGRTHEGTQMGLSLVHEMAKLHGGHVEAQSEYGRGSTFTVTIPTGRDHLPAVCIMPRAPATEVPARAYLAEAAHWIANQTNAGEERSEAADDGSQKGEEILARANVLVVDDNAGVRVYLARVLGTEYEVRTATNGTDAIRMARERLPSLVLADVMMPEVDGVELLRAVRNDPQTCMVPVVLISAQVDEEARAHGLQSGADDYLIKPFTSCELRARVAAQLRMAEIRQAAIGRERELRASLEAFLATLSHELRSPLQAAWAAVGMLRSRVPHERFLDVLDRQMTYLRRLVDDLLDASRIAHGKIQLQQTRQDCRRLAAEAADIVRPTAAERHIELSLETPDEELAVIGDGVRLVEVLTNLLNNAIKYTGEGGRVLLRALRSEASVEIRVSDTGKGIPKEELPKIFQLFAQGVEGLEGGLGIGLAVSAQLVQLHGGTVNAHSDGPGRGSEFVVKLPAAT